VISESTLVEEFPIKRSTAYFNNASYTPMSRGAISAITRALERYSAEGPSDSFYLVLKGGANGSRTKLASLLRIKDPSDIVFTESATQGINMIANGFKFASGDSLIVRGWGSEHPSNFLPWVYFAEKKSLRLHNLITDELGFPDLSELDSTLKKTRAKLVVASHVLYNLGTIMKAREMCKISHERDASFFLDVSQSVGNIPVDLEEIGCDYAAGTAAKWLCGPLGLGFLYCSKGALDTIDPLNFGANSATYKPDGSYALFDGASRLQEGFRNWSFAYGLEYAIDLLCAFGIDNVRSKNLKNADAIIEKIDSCPDKYKYIGSRRKSERTCIIPVETLKAKPSEVVVDLAGKGIVIAEREIGERKVLRISPHFYNCEQEIERLTRAM